MKMGVGRLKRERDFRAPEMIINLEGRGRSVSLGGIK
jgi:hypothetical protein